MKKIAMLLFCVNMFTGLTYAQEMFSGGVGIQANDYSTNFFGFGVTASADFRFNELFSLGTTFLYSIDLGNSARKAGHPPLNIYELSVNARWYFLRFKTLVDWYFMWQNYLHWFVQADLGFSVLDADNKTMVSRWSNIPLMFGLSFGVRVMLGNAFVEPYVRAGQPYLWGVGFIVGYRFTGKE